MTAPLSMVTLLSLRTRARELSNMESGNGTTFISDAEANRRVNEAISYVWDLIVRAGGGADEVKTSAAITLVSGTANYELPTDFMSARAVMAGPPGQLEDLDKWDEPELAALMSTGGTGLTSNVSELRYRVSGQKDDGQRRIMLAPAPGASGWFLYVRYAPAAPVLAGDSEKWDGINGWERLVAALAARDFLVKEESDTTALDIEISKQEARIAGLANRRDGARPKRIIDTRRDTPARYGWERYR